jgi:hypothetical protein
MNKTVCIGFRNGCTCKPCNALYYELYGNTCMIPPVRR